MFDEQMEKGLFTFYWESNQKEKAPGMTSRRSQESLPVDAGPLKMGKRIEEKQIRMNHHKTQKIQPERYIKPQECQYYPFDKENKSILIPHRVTLSPTLEPTPREKNRKQEGRIRHGNEHVESRANEGKRERQQKMTTVMQRLQFMDQPVECHKKTLEIDEFQALTKSAYIHTSRPMKIKKSMFKENHQIEGKDFLDNKLPLIKTPQQSPVPTNRLPLLFGRHSKKKLKHSKDGHFIQKLLAEKQLNTSNSVINIGMGSTDEYKTRWKKRKEEFLSLITKNLSKEQGGAQ